MEDMFTLTLINISAFQKASGSVQTLFVLGQNSNPGLPTIPALIITLYISSSINNYAFSMRKKKPISNQFSLLMLNQ